MSFNLFTHRHHHCSVAHDILIIESNFLDTHTRQLLFSNIKILRIMNEIYFMNMQVVSHGQDEDVFHVF